MSKRDSYLVKSVDDILRVPDMRTAMGLLKEWNLETKGLKTKDDALKKLLEFWNKADEKPKKQETNAFMKAIGVDKKNRQTLSDKYDEVKKFYKKLPKQHQTDLDNFLDDIQSNIETKKKDLCHSDCTILIAGETASGKSSFVNLLLGTEILPTSDLRCTTTVCEIRTSQDGKKYAVLHHRSGAKKNIKPEHINLENEKGLNTLSRFITKVDEETEESPYSRIEVYWPIPLLEEGMVIVDTPGIGGSKQLNKCVERYLAKSFGFIYIINSATAGGVQKGRLQDFLRLVVTSVDEDFIPRATMFICNKWDTVPECDRLEVQKATFVKLQRCYPGVREDQIFRISVQECLKAANYGGMVTEHKEIMRGLEALLPASLRNQLASHYRWMSQVLKRSHYSLKVSKLMDAKGIKEKEEMQTALQKQMNELDKNAKYKLESMRFEIRNETEKLYSDICRLLTSSDVLHRLCRWESRDCPSTENWKKVVKEAEVRIAKRVNYEISVWDEERGVVKGLKEKIVKKFKRDFELMEDQMRVIEGVLLPGETKVISDFQKSMKRPTPVKHIFAKAGRDSGGKQGDDSIRRLSGAVASSGLLDPKSRDVRGIFRKYDRATAHTKMGEATQQFVKSITDGKHLRTKLDNFLGKYLKGIDDIAKMIPSIIKADRQLMENLNFEKSQSETNMRSLYPELLSECSSMQGKLDMFFVTNIMEQDFRMRDIHYEQSNRLGKGSFAVVYKGKLKTKESESERSVALKIAKEPISTRNVSETLLEDRTMRDLRHTHVVKYYGSVLRLDSGNKLTWIMVMEFCRDTLKNVVLADEYNNPGKEAKLTRRQEDMRDMAELVIQICQGLDYLHGKDLVHRDLKLENILVSTDKKIKLTDVGLTKGIDDITGTMAGSPVYMAPEVLQATDIYDHKADIYSLAVIIWEIWYGVDSADHIQHQIYRSLLESVLGGLRPSLSMKHKPPEDWEAIIVKCWSLEPKHRLEAREVGNFFDRFLECSR